jgi:hypothetical protein
MVAGGPAIAPAFGSGAYSVSVSAQPGQVFGPHAGFLGNGTGQNGTTEVFRISVPGGASISTARVVLTSDNTDIALGRDFADGDGFALYANTDSGPSFSAQDKRQGLMSAGWQQERTDSDGNTPIRILLPQPATGHTDYFITVHPSSTVYPNRTFSLKVAAGGINGSDDGPSSDVQTPTASGQRYVIDSVAPGAPLKTYFTANPRFPGTEDFYTVNKAVSSEPGIKVAFFNDGSDVSEANVLVHPNGSPAIDTVAPSDASASKNITIGDGTGITPKVTVALNHQKNNSVFARLVDTVGNYSDKADLIVADGRGNIVTAPGQPTTAAFGSGVKGINESNQAAVPVTITSTATGNDDTHSAQATTALRLVQLDGSNALDFTKTGPPSSVTFAANLSTNLDSRPVAGPNGYTGIAENASAEIEAVNVDAQGNRSEPVYSTSSKRKDTVFPVLSVVDAPRSGTGVPGDQVTVQFSEPMDITTIPNDSATSDCSGAINAKLPVTTAGSAARTWGYNACWKWNADQSSGTIYVGDANDPGPPACGPPLGGTCAVLFETTDVVKPDGGVPPAAASITDLAGNQVRGLGGTANSIGTTTVGNLTARPTSAITNDANADGVLDSVDVTFSAPVDTAGFATYSANLSAVGPVATPVTSVTYPTAGVFTTLRFAFGGGFGTGEQPTIRLVRGAGNTTGLFTKEASPREVLPFAAFPADKAAPRPISVTYLDTDSPTDGHIDHVSVVYSEPIDHSLDANNDATVPTAGFGYRVPGYETTATPPSSTKDHNSVTPTSGSTTTKMVNLTESASFDTGSLSVTLGYKKTSGGTALDDCSADTCVATDSSGNTGDDYTKPVADGAAPAIISRVTRDLDADGRIDAIDVKFSEFLSTPSLGQAQFTVAGHQILDQFGLAPGDAIRLVIDELPLRGQGDTDAKPVVTFAGGAADTAGNVTPKDNAGVASTDGAAPAIVAACPMTPTPGNGTCPPGTDGTKLRVYLSEPVASGVDQADFVVEQPAGTTKAQNAAPVVVASTNNKQWDLSFAAGATALDRTKDAFVHLSGAGVLTDGTNASTQTATVTAYAPPTVSLAITCPVVSNPGYCGATFVNTGAAGSGGVSLWRLAETARSATPPDSEFSPTQPSRYPASGTLTEGTHTLYLSGKDDYGRLSPEVSATIKILKAPTISGVSYLNLNPVPSTSPAWQKTDTVLDGDSFRVGADAYGTDAAQWASSNGGCLGQYMQVNYKPVTNVGSQTAVAPFSCDLKSSVPPHRHLEFPFVKAAGTTKFPVGTVLVGSSSTEGGSMVVDGANGGLARRAFISAGARRSWMISDSQVIKTPSQVTAGLSRLGFIGYRDGAILRGPNGAYYYAFQGGKRPVSTATLAYWNIPTSAAYNVTQAELNAMPTGVALGKGQHAAGTWIKFPNGVIQQITRNAAGQSVRRQVASLSALRTLVPSSQIYPVSTYDKYIPFDATWYRGYRDGTIVKINSTTYGVVARTALRQFASSKTFFSLGFNTSNALPFVAAAMPHPGGQTYATGTPIDRYKITGMVITIKNNAGNTAQATVLPATGGIYGVGTIDPVPLGYDKTKI